MQIGYDFGRRKKLVDALKVTVENIAGSGSIRQSYGSAGHFYLIVNVWTQVPGENPGLHVRCRPGCSDPFQILPLHLVYKVLRLLDPASLASAQSVR